MRRLLPLSVAALFLIPLSLAVAAPQEAPAKTPDFMVGTWALQPVQDAADEHGSGKITLVLTLADGRLAGTAVIPAQEGEKRWPLVQPTFVGKTFSFKVDNGDSLLQGEMRLVGEAFEGSWISAGGDAGGRLTMTRKPG
jgi:hypothetical protein